MTREQAIELLKQNIQNPNLIRHGIAVEAIMQGLAKHFGQNEDEWGSVGLLHDLDWEKTRDEPEKHSKVTKEILEKTDLKPELIQAIYVHNYLHNEKPETLLEKSLYCVEELSGLITAAALVQPDKKLASVTSESVLKKFRSKSFAANVNREIISQSEEMLGLDLLQVISISLEAMKVHASEIGL